MGPEGATGNCPVAGKSHDCDFPRNLLPPREAPGWAPGLPSTMPQEFLSPGALMDHVSGREGEWAVVPATRRPRVAGRGGIKGGAKARGGETGWRVGVGKGWGWGWGGELETMPPLPSPHSHTHTHTYTHNHAHTPAASSESLFDPLGPLVSQGHPPHSPGASKLHEAPTLPSLEETS